MIKGRVKREELLKYIAGVKPIYKGVNRKAYKGVGLYQEGGELKVVLVKDNTVGVEGKLTIKTEEEKKGDTVVELKKIEEALKSIKTEEVELESVKEGRGVRLSAVGKVHTIEIPTLKAQAENIKSYVHEGYTGIILTKVEDEEVELEIEGKKLKNLLEKVEYARSGEEYTNQLQGVIVEVKEGSLVFTAVDGYRLATQKEEVEGIECKEKAIILNSNMVEVLKKTVKKQEKIKIKLGTKRSRVELELEGVEVKLVGANYEGDILKYEKLFNREITKEIEIDVKEYKEGLKMLEPHYTGGRSNRVMTELTKDKMRLYVEKDKDKIEDDVEVICETELELKGSNIEETFVIAYNGKYIMDCLKTLKNGVLKVEYNSPIDAMTFTVDTEKGLRYLCLPVRVRRV